MERHLTVAETAEALGVSQTTVRGMLTALEAVDIRCGAGKQRCIRIPESGIQRYLDGCRIRQAISPAERFHIPRRRAGEGG